MLDALSDIIISYTLLYHLPFLSIQYYIIPRSITYDNPIQLLSDAIIHYRFILYGVTQNIPCHLLFNPITSYHMLSTLLTKFCFAIYDGHTKGGIRHHCTSHFIMSDQLRPNPTISHPPQTCLVGSMFMTLQKFLFRY